MTQFGSSLVGIARGDQLVADIFALAVLTVLFTLLSTGVIRGWRWTFWLVLVAFIVNGLRVPLALVQLSALAPRQGSELVTVLEVAVGLLQVLIAAAMLIGYRRAGVWGDAF